MNHFRVSKSFVGSIKEYKDKWALLTSNVRNVISLKIFLSQYLIRANRTPLLIRTPGDIFGYSMVIFGKIVCKFCSNLGQKSSKNDRSVLPKSLNNRTPAFYLPRYGNSDFMMKIWNRNECTFLEQLRIS